LRLEVPRRASATKARSFCLNERRVEQQLFGRVTNDFAVTGMLASDGAGIFDFGHAEANPIHMSFSATIMSYGSSQEKSVAEAPCFWQNTAVRFMGRR